MKKFVYLLFTTLLVSCSSQDKQSDPNTVIEVRTEQDTLKAQDGNNNDSYGIKSTNTEHNYSARIIYTDSLGWGYQIFDGNKMMINQVHIPSIQGRKGFKSRQSAQITANFILYKLSNNLFPPTVDEKELDSLGVL